jgi:hypothetical protein
MMTNDQLANVSTPGTSTKSDALLEIKKPDDCGSISVTGFVKIFDPNTKEIIVETRA